MDLIENWKKLLYIQMLKNHFAVFFNFENNELGFTEEG